MTLKLYFDLLSQPSRAVFIFLKANKIDFQPMPIALRKNAQLTDDYKQINRFHTVPVIDDNGFKLMESIAILRYITREKKTDDYWFPKDSIKQAKVDEYLEWQHHNTRFLCNFYLQRKYLIPLQTGKPTKEELVEESMQRMVDCFEKIQDIWLDKQPFLTGDKITIADLLGACELEQIRLTGYNIKEEFPKIGEWMARVKSHLNPHYDEAHSVVAKIVEKMKNK